MTFSSPTVAGTTAFGALSSPRWKELAHTAQVVLAEASGGEVPLPTSPPLPEKPGVQEYVWVSHRPVLVAVTVCMIASLALTLSLTDSVVGASMSGLAFWTCFYFLLTVPCEYYFGTDLLGGFSRGSYFVSLFHQGPVCVAFLLGILVAHASRDWWQSDWGGYSYMAERHVHLSIIGYELKDFFLGSVSAGFAVHHAFTFAGCSLCLFSPGGVGMITVNALNAELGSFFANLFVVRRTASVLALFALLMTGSNLVAGWITVEYWSDSGTNLGFRLAYVCLAVALILVRSVGILLYIHEFQNPTNDAAASTTKPEQGNESKEMAFAGEV